jgi:hypothetical protein
MLRRECATTLGPRRDGQLMTVGDHPGCGGGEKYVCMFLSLGDRQEPVVVASGWVRMGGNIFL